MGATSYSNLEFDLTTGKRGSRYTLVEDIICDLTGAEAALVVNNNAAAVLIALDTIARGKEVIVSRGQLVEIGGSFRVPDVMAKSGATLVEVGATNRTHLYDYERAITENTALMLQVHTSNFRMIGFTSQVSAEQLVGLGAEKNILVMEDLGSGCFIDLSKFGLPAEPTVQDAVKSGVDVVTFSGDKLLGGPQAGLIVGKKDTIDKIKKNPLNRALRIDKFTLASLESVLRHYYDINEALTAIPTLRMISEEPGVIKRRVQRFLRRTKHIEEKLCTFKMVKTQSMVGGGALPEYCLDGWGVEISPQQIDISTMERGFRSLRPPIIGRIERERYILDFRTISDKDVKDLVDVLTGYFHGDAVGS
jgi:L-seryl-tRNA(Ser) seleniumtransferase